MSERIFRPGYYYAGEVKFKAALKEGRLEDAKEILESFPTGDNEIEDGMRAVALTQGYRALTEKYDELVTDLRQLCSKKEDEVGSSESTAQDLRMTPSLSHYLRFPPEIIGLPTCSD
jgi:hypothetical protein